MRGSKFNIYGKMFKNLLLENYNATVWDFLSITSLAIVDSKLLETFSPVYTGAPRGVSSLTMKYKGNMFKKFPLENYNFEFSMQGSSNNEHFKL